MTEAVTGVADGHVSDEDWPHSLQSRSPKSPWLATVMNAFSRAAVTSRYRVAA